MIFPLLTEADPAQSSEGALDPLGLYAIADSLAVRLVPGVRERQSHPRFLTAIAVSLFICSDFDEERIAIDGVSEPWQVFEWYMVEGLVRKISKEEKFLQGLPGREKAAQTLRDGVPLSAKRYLKTPRVFGFHGVYRVLSRTLGVEVARGLGELGYELITVWGKEQGKKGLQGSALSPDAPWHRMIKDAVDEGLKKGCVTRGPGWAGWQFFRQHLAHKDVGENEAHLLARALMRENDGFRRQILRFLASPNGRQVWEETSSERQFHASLMASESSDLKDLLWTIAQYETFSRLLQDAFDDCRFTMTQARGKTSLLELQSLAAVRLAVEKVPPLFEKLVETLSPYKESWRFQNNFVSLSERLSPKDWVERLLDHHQKVQRNKPPNGKAPWCVRLDDGSYIIRSGYRRDEGGRHNDDYVHAYRTVPLWSFATDLGMIA